MTWKEEALAIDTTTYEPMAYDLRGYRDQESFVKGDFSATYAHPTGTWNLTGYVKNLTNYAEKTSYIVMGGGRGTMMIGSPRTYGGVLSVKF